MAGRADDVGPDAGTAGSPIFDDQAERDSSQLGSDPFAETVNRSVGDTGGGEESPKAGTAPPAAYGRYRIDKKVGEGGFGDPLPFHLVMQKATLFLDLFDGAGDAIMGL